MYEQYFDYKLEPGKDVIKSEYENIDTVISVIIPFFNDGKYIRQTVNSVLNQTFPNYEILIIDDGSNDQASIEKLNDIQKMDSRINIYHKENEGLSATRDYGAKKTNEKSKYLLFLDSDDLIEPTFLECAYWTLETNKDASWAYSDSVGFGSIEYLWSKRFDCEKLKKQNDLIATCLIRKEAFESVNGYEIRKKAVNEDWNFWLKLIAKGKYPVHMSYYGMWYRRKKDGELARANNNKQKTQEIIEKTIKTINNKVEAIQYPRYTYNWEKIEDKVSTIKVSKKKNTNKTNILIIVPWLVTGGADKFVLELTNRINKDKYNIIILFTEPNINVLRQQIEQNATVYDLTTFLDQRYWLGFINYIIEKENINIIFNTNSLFGYEALPYLKERYPKISILDYVHMEEWYNRKGGYARDSSVMNNVIDKTLVCNENTKKVLVDHFQRNENDIRTVYIGVDEKEFAPNKYDKNELKKKYNIESKLVISYISRITSQKRPFLLLEIISRLKNINESFTFVVAGDGDLLQKMKYKAKKMKIEDKIIFLGNVKDTREIYSISDITINCSIKEGVALTSYESLAMGVPIISSDVGGQKELISNDVGIIVPCLQQETDINNFNYSDEEVKLYVDAIKRIIEKLDIYKEGCRKRIISNFTLDNMIHEMEKYFDEEAGKEKTYKCDTNTTHLKELVSLYFECNKYVYQNLCNNYHQQVYGTYYSANIQLIREKLWENPLWRAFVKLIKKTGIIKILKKNN